MRGWSVAFAGVCAFVAVAAQIVFVLHGDPEGLASLFDAHPRLSAGYLPLVAVLTFVVPVGLIFGVRRLNQGISTPAWRGLIAGLALALWCNAMAVSVFYVGLYPSLPTIVLFFFILLEGPASWVKWAFLLLGNVVVYGAAGVAWSVARNRQAGK